MSATAAKTKRHKRHAKKAVDSGYVQVRRLGNPLMNEVVIPLGKKDQFNSHAAEPGREAVRQVRRQAGARARDERAVPHQRSGDEPHGHRAGAAHGHPGARRRSASTPCPADTLKINLGVPPTANPNRFGVLGGDNAGFPNGRRLGDDVSTSSSRWSPGAEGQQACRSGTAWTRTTSRSCPRSRTWRRGLGVRLEIPKPITPPHAPTP